MGRSALIRTLLVALVTALVVFPAPALAAKPIAQFHDHFTDSFSDEICGIPVDVDVVVTDNFFVYADDTFKDTSSVKQTFTNPANGKSVVLSVAGQITGPPPVVDEEAGTITFLTSFKGLPEKIRRRTGPSCSVTPASSRSPTPSTWRPASSSPPRPSSTRGRTQKPTVTSRSSAK
jgi:hypothetical protein